MKDKELKKYKDTLLKSVFENMTQEEKDVILKFYIKVAIVHLGVQEILKHLENVHKTATKRKK